MPEIKTREDVRKLVNELVRHGAQEVGCRVIAYVGGTMRDVGTFGTGQQPFFKPGSHYGAFVQEHEAMVLQLSAPASTAEPTPAPAPTEGTGISVDPEPHTEPVEPGSPPPAPTPAPGPRVPDLGLDLTDE